MSLTRVIVSPAVAPPEPNTTLPPPVTPALVTEYCVPSEGLLAYVKSVLPLYTLTSVTSNI